ncbi:Transposon Ty3-G Gag-Pol polyprotein [Halotydeus destructor]|nr:Transposon Ty3-G Gag-Pol polyprotein [Halotydeus destructor]
MKNYFSLANDKMGLRQALNEKKQEFGENADEYITTKLQLCKKVNAKMEEEEKILAIIDGFQPRLKQVLTALNPLSVKELLKQACQYERSFRAEIEYSRPNFRHGPWERVARDINREEQYSGPNTRRERYPYRGQGRHFAPELSDARQPRGTERYGLGYQGQRSDHFEHRTEHRPGHRDEQQVDSRPDQRKQAVESTEDKFSPRTNTGRIRCYNCGGPHYVRNCPEQEQLPAGNVNSVVPKEVDQQELIEGFGRIQTLSTLKPVTGFHLTKGQLIRSQGYLNGKPVTCMVDTGSTTTCITPFAAHRCAVEIKDYSGPTFLSADGKDIEAAGYAETRVGIRVKNTVAEITMPVLVLEGLGDDVLLGSDFLGEAGVMVDCEARALSIKKPIERRIQTVQGRVAPGLEIYLGVRRTPHDTDNDGDDAENRIFFPLAVNMLRVRPDRLPVGQYRNVLVSLVHIRIRPGGAAQLPVEPFGFEPVYGKIYEVGQAENQISVIPHHIYFRDNSSEIYVENETKNTLVIREGDMVAYAIFTDETIEELDQRLDRLRIKYQMRTEAKRSTPFDRNGLGLYELGSRLLHSKTCASEAETPALIENEFGSYLNTVTLSIPEHEPLQVLPPKSPELEDIPNIEEDVDVVGVDSDEGMPMSLNDEQTEPVDLSNRLDTGTETPDGQHRAPPTTPTEPESPGYRAYDVVEETGRREWPIIVSEDFLIPPATMMRLRIRHVFPSYEPIEYVQLVSQSPDLALEGDLVAMIHGELPSIRVRNTSHTAPVAGVLGCLIATGRILNPMEIRNYIDEHDWDDLAVFEVQQGAREVIEEDNQMRDENTDGVPQDTDGVPQDTDKDTSTLAPHTENAGRVQMLHFKGRTLTQRQVNEVLEFDLDGMIEYLDTVNPDYENVHQYDTVAETVPEVAANDHGRWTTVHMPRIPTRKVNESSLESLEAGILEHHISFKNTWSLYAGLLAVLLLFGTFMRLTEAVSVENAGVMPSLEHWHWLYPDQQMLIEIAVFTLVLTVLGVMACLFYKRHRNRHRSYGVQQTRGYWIMNLSSKPEETIDHELDVKHPDLDTFAQKQLGKGQVFNPSLVTEIRSDASIDGLGCLLVQKDEDGWHVCAYASRCLSDTETRYPPTELETLGIVFALRKFRMYVVGVKFTVVTDHHSLCYLMKKQQLAPRLARWAIELAEFNFDIRYKSGCVHKDADCLSRYPVDTPANEEERMIQVLQIQAPTKDDLVAKQDAEDDLKHLKYLCRTYDVQPSKERCRVAKYTVVDGVLYRKKRSSNGDIKLVPVIPKAMREDILYHYHDDPTAGHLGYHKTLDRVRDRFYFAKMAKYVRRYVQTCIDCQTKKYPAVAPAGLLQPLETTEPFERLGIDILGPFPRSSLGNRHIIVATEYATRYGFAKAIPDANALAVAQFVVDEIISKFGTPKTILTDRGVQFTSELFNTVTRLMGIKCVKTIEIMLDIPNTGTKNPATYSQLLAKQMAVIREVAKDNLKKVQQESVSRYNSTHNPVEFLEGDHVLIDSPTRYVHRATKLLHRWRGPYEVTKKHSPLKYEVRLINSKNKKTDTVHISRMKPYYTRDRLSSSESDSSSSSVQYSLPEINAAISPENCDTLTVLPTTSEPKAVTPPTGNESEILSADYVDQEEAVEPNYHADSDTEIDEDTELPKEAVPLTQTASTPTVQRTGMPKEKLSLAPRKSTRIKTATKMFQLPFLIIGMLSLTASANFNRASPVVWRSTQEKLITGNEAVFAIVKLEDTCEIFRELPASMYTMESKEQYLKWCNRAFKEDVLDKLNGFCTDVDSHHRTPTTVSMHRQKRAIFTIALIIGVVISVGFSAVASVINMVQMSDVKQELQNINERLAHVNRSIEINQQVLRLLEDKMKEQGIAIQENREHIKRLEATFPQSTILVSHLASQFASARMLLNTVGRQWKNKKVDEQLIDFLNITLPCGDDCPLNLATAGKCELDRYRNILKMEFDLTKVNRQVKIMKADPFIQLLPGSNAQQLCYQTYIGPMHVLIEEDNTCLMPLPDSAFHEKGYIVSPTTKYCLDWGVKEDAPKLWSSSTCVRADDINPTVRTQVKMTDTDNHIYCPRLNITLHGVRMACPDYVFTLPKTVSFKIGRLEYNATSHRVDTTKHIESDWAHRLSFLINPPFKDFKQDFNDTDKLIATFDKPQTQALELQVHGALWASCSIFIMLLLLFLLRALWLLRSKQPQRYVEIELTEQATPTATIHRSQRTPKLTTANLTETD